MLKIPVGVSNRHIHLCEKDFETLFGKGSQLKVYKELSQPGQFAAEQKLDLIGPKGTIAGVRILGPFRSQTQVEISRTDSFRLGIKSPVRDSGDLAGSAPITLKGPAGSIELSEGVIIARSHIHIHTDVAKENGLSDKQIVSVKSDGIRSLTFNNVVIRVSDDYNTEMHIDTDEANAALLNNGDLVSLIV